MAFHIDPATQSALQAGYDALTISIQANLVDAAEPLVIDNLRFTCNSAVDTDGSPMLNWWPFMYY